MSANVQQAYRLAAERYREMGVDAGAALAKLKTVPISLHCWQGDDVKGFEDFGGELGGGLAATGNYPGAARTPDELRADAAKALSLIPGTHRFNLHAFYGEFKGKKVDRDEILPEHFAGWIDWARSLGLGLDFNPTYFSHPKAADNFTLSHADRGIRDFWIRHGIACRRIAEAMGRAVGKTCITNFWIPDGMKDTPVDRRGPRERLIQALDEILAAPVDQSCTRDSVEGKLFAIGIESYTVGSHEFYQSYSLARRTLFTLDTGHYHPTETITDKISAILSFIPEILLHVSRGVRWDSDHVVTLGDDLGAIAQELVRGDYLGRTHIGLDYFDASINRVAAWVIGVRNMLKALLQAMLEPIDRLREAERSGDYTARLALLEEAKTLPFGAVWDYYCETAGVPVGEAWLSEVQAYERDVLARRG
ncbi:MAG TPA: L-rhamnose isomerase [Vicinamibacterales bacterium]|nr:L-rhamnose isomerase [Vicinamibacterales bacterium]HPW21328.1 L-rhamnose isomerase [Vicinamibacterales bacterium]